MNNVLIIGGGIVGTNMKKIFTEADIHDPFLKMKKKEGKKYDIGFICVPTPMLPDGSCDISYVERAIEENKNDVKIFVIKSTVPPGTTKKIDCSYGQINIIFSPEYFGETIHANGYNYDFVIFGYNKNIPEALYKVTELYKNHYTGEIRFYFTDSTTAELVKYMENSFLALKVTFCNEFYRLANRLGVNYDELRELFIADPRVGRSHTFVYRDHPYYESKCLDKDVPAIISFAEKMGAEMDLMYTVKAVNEKFRNESK
jgi:UDPglucose 6-dehydrogenase